VRTLLSSLTGRGRTFLSAGATALAGAYVLGLDDLARVGVLLLVVPIVSALLLRRFRHRLGLSRRVEPGTVTAGQPATVRLQMSCEGSAVGGILLLEEQLPYVLGARPRFVLDRTRWRWSREMTYRVRPDLRGHYTLGPMTVRVTDPLGMVESHRSFTSHSELLVTPRVEELPPIRLAGSWTGSGDNRPRAFAGGSAADVTIREYRRGDDLRRVHWRSSARTGELMVRREEQPWQSRATVFVDNRRRAHRGEGPSSSFERAVSAAASIAMHLVARGYRVRLTTADPAGPATQQWHEHGVTASESAPLLESLAVLPLSDRLRIDTSWATGSQQGGLVVAVLGGCTMRDSGALRSLRHSADHALALQLDLADDGAGPADEVLGTPWLVGHGWRAAPIDTGDSVPEVWRGLGAGRSGVMA
jgi:uncharacterized protein (DUF58 family)